MQGPHSSIGMMGQGGGWDGGSKQFLGLKFWLEGSFFGSVNYARILNRPSFFGYIIWSSAWHK